MKRMAFNFNIRPYCFSIFLLLFAISPVAESNDVVYYAILAVMLLSLLVMLASAIISISKDKKGFIESAIAPPDVHFWFFYILTSLVGIVVGYSLNSDTYKFWIFLLVLMIIPILIPPPKTEKTQ